MYIITTKDFGEVSVIGTATNLSKLHAMLALIWEQNEKHDEGCEDSLPEYKELVKHFRNRAKEAIKLELTLVDNSNNHKSLQISSVPESNTRIYGF